jgi:hypothetical protein
MLAVLPYEPTTPTAPVPAKNVRCGEYFLRSTSPGAWLNPIYLDGYVRRFHVDSSKASRVRCGANGDSSTTLFPAASFLPTFFPYDAQARVKLKTMVLTGSCLF